MVRKCAVVAGHICLDIFPELDHLPPGGISKLFETGQLLRIGKALFATGGPVSNTGIALHKLGIPTRLLCKIGPDLFGNAVRDLIYAYAPELAADMRIDPGTSTAYTIILSFPGADRVFMGHPGASDTYGAEDIDYDLASQADLFHFGYPPVMRRMYSTGGLELADIFRQAKAASLKQSPLTSLDMAFPDPGTPGGQADWRLIMKRVLPYVDIFLPSIEELFYMLHREQYDEFISGLGAGNLPGVISPGLLYRLSSELIEMGVKIAVIKLGERGLYLRTATFETLEPLAGSLDISTWSGKELWAPCFKVQVAGTTGAGDATIAGFLSGLLRGLPPDEAMTMAVAVGACNVEAVDALSGICSWEEIEARVKAGWQRHVLWLEEPGWEWDPALGLWVGKSDG
jgi:sugar/nucleoside kinase (ribokinase family)